MIYEKLYLILPEILEQFPKLLKIYKNYINNNYIVENISISSDNDSDESFRFQAIQLIFKDDLGKRILLNSLVFNNDEQVIQYELPYKTEIYPGINLNAEIIRNVKFKKNLFGGYREFDVDSFLDLVISDYKFIYENLLKK